MTVTIDYRGSMSAAVELDESPLCEHSGCRAGTPGKARPLLPGPDGEDLGGPRRPASWGGHGPGTADLDGPACPSGLDYCCGLCGCRED